MGRHKKLADDLEDDELANGAVTEQRSRERSPLSWVTKVPLLPTIAGLGAIGVVAAAWSTSQISLNFAGGSPSRAEQPQSQRGSGDRMSRSDRAKAVTVAFRENTRVTTGFSGTATIVNHGTQPIKDWTLVFRIPNASVLSVWNAVLVKRGSVATVQSSPKARPIAPGQSVRVLFAASGAASRPSTCRFNGVPCTQR
ncbi:MAG: cellulose-binding family [Streptosporangiaceae bacterium]|jgi:hypothetical protein|nr:cellulose-binding family [Streptosporangiaceae bacterium]